MWLGYVTFGFVSDALGRKPTYIVYLLAASALMWAYAVTRDPSTLLLLGPFVAFFGTGYFSGFGAITAEMYPTAVRATAQGVTYNIGRIASAVAPFVVGTPGGDARLRPGAVGGGGGVPGRGGLLDLDSGDPRPRPRLTLALPARRAAPGAGMPARFTAGPVKVAA